MEDGIYFDLPEKDYHRLPRLSASGIANMLISPATFWARSWMNPEREKNDKDTPARILGRAYHMARLEPDRFAETYAAELGPDDFEDDEILMNDAEIKAALADMGLPQSQKEDGGVLGRAKRLEAAGYTGKIWHLELERHQAATEGKITIPRQYMEDIARDVAAMRSNGLVAELLEEGSAEVSILWTDERTGIKMKARLDYLAAHGQVDFKTYDNPMGKDIHRKIADDFMYNRYYIQAILYHQALEIIRKGGLSIIGEASLEQRQTIAHVQARPFPVPVYYIFQEKSGIPNLWVREIMLYHRAPATHLANAGGVDDGKAAVVADRQRRMASFHIKGKLEIEWACNMFNLYMEERGPLMPWSPIDPNGELGDGNFPTWWLET